MRTRSTRIVVAVLLLLSCIGATQARDRWLHVRVQGGDSERVSVNIPLQLIESMLPLVQVEGLKGGRLRLDRGHLEGLDLREVLTALRDSPDGRFVNVQSREESVRVAKERGYLVVLAEERDLAGEAESTVHARLPLAVVEAMLASGAEELDLVAGLRKLAEFEGEDLVSIRSRNEQVRVWIDRTESGE